MTFQVAASYKSNSNLFTFQNLSNSKADWRINRSLTPPYKALLGIAKTTGKITAYVGPCLTGYEMYVKHNDNDPTTNITVRDGVDMTLGVAGFGGPLLATIGVVSNPVGWGIAGASGVVQTGLLLYDHREEINEGMKARQKYVSSGQMPIR